MAAKESRLIKLSFLIIEILNFTIFSENIITNRVMQNRKKSKNKYEI